MQLIFPMNRQFPFICKFFQKKMPILINFFSCQWIVIVEAYSTLQQKGESNEISFYQQDNWNRFIVFVSVLKRILSCPGQPRSGYFETRASYLIQDDQMLIEFELVNHYDTAKQLQFGSGQQFEVVITNEAGDEVYRYSDGKMFTMALVLRDIKPGESLKWQDKWDLTDQDGPKLSSGKYTVEVQVLVIPDDSSAAIPAEQLTAALEINLAEGIIKETAEQVIRALRDQDADRISAFVHPEKGVRFTPYTFVSLDRDLVFNQEGIKNFFTDDKEYLWGYFDGTGWEIRMTPAEYYQRFVYSHDFADAEQVGYNEVLSFGNMLENQFEVYEDLLLWNTISLVSTLIMPEWIGKAYA